MESSFAIFSSISGFLTIGLAIFELVIAIIAQSKHKIPPTTLMIIGAVFGLICSLFYPLANLIGYNSWFEVGQVVIMMLNMMATLLFLIGLLQLVQYIAAGTAEENLNF